MKPRYLESASGINSIVYGASYFTQSIYVYLHGAGEFGPGFDRQYKYPGFATLLRDDEMPIKHPFILACCQNGNQWNANEIASYISDLGREFTNTEIDLIGYSRGGRGVYSYITSHTRVRTATIINSKPPSMESSEFKVPVHIIHAEKDQVTPIESVKIFLRGCSSENVCFTVFQGDHYSVESIAKSGIWSSWIERTT